MLVAVNHRSGTLLHVTPNVLYLDGHAKSVPKSEAYLGMYPGGVILTDPSWYP